VATQLGADSQLRLRRVLAIVAVAVVQQADQPTVGLAWHAALSLGAGASVGL